MMVEVTGVTEVFKWNKIIRLTFSKANPDSCGGNQLHWGAPQKAERMSTVLGCRGISAVTQKPTDIG